MGICTGRVRKSGILSEPARDQLRVGPAALKAGSECSFTAVNSASSPALALHGSSSQDRKRVLWAGVFRRRGSG
ncbi:hypothetical protein FXN65_15645 [Metapseudomonas lalkuanensis]|uniref:Uncharacterized protein n=1 Tax=Metapseudomonas lalkuanensis TaxID=2604832 RepID=A0A5J6QM31_9GAMM|nr:hypothetical protein FXN65_15645 [Pseudomonas lalkuanensis]